MEILGKFGAAMQGFWWSLDDEERLRLLIGVGQLILFLVVIPVQARARQREREELVAAVTEEVLSRGR